MTDLRPKPASDADPRLDRRAFLGAAGGATAALALAACGAGAPAPARRPAVRPAGAREAAFHSRRDLRPPQILVDRRPSDPRRSTFVFTDCHGGRGQQGPIIIDRSGRLVWFHPVSDHGSAAQRVMNLRVQTYRGQPVLTWWQGGVIGGHGAGHYEICDQRYRQVARVQAGNGYVGDLHEFQLTERGTALLTAYGQATGEIPTPDRRATREGAYWFGVAQEVDVETGRVLLEWRSDDHVPVSASRLTPPRSATQPWDYFHMNSLAVDPTDDNLVISARNTWSAYKVHRDTGELLWTLGGDAGDFRMGESTEFAFQHDVVPRGGGRYTIFDNEAGPPDHAAQSRGLVLAVDESARTVSFVREYLHRPAVLSQALGNVQELEDDGAFVGWGESSYFTEYDGSGEAVLDVHLSGGVISYRAFLDGWAGEPAHLPRAAVVRAGRGAQVYASWNGATVHRRWRVLGGARRGALTQSLRVADVTGFETRVDIARAPAWIAVEALDERGSVAARSDPVRA